MVGGDEPADSAKQLTAGQIGEEHRAGPEDRSNPEGAEQASQANRDGHEQRVAKRIGWHEASGPERPVAQGKREVAVLRQAKRREDVLRLVEVALGKTHRLGHVTVGIGPTGDVGGVVVDQGKQTNANGDDQERLDQRAPDATFAVDDTFSNRSLRTDM